MIHHVFANRSNVGDWLSARGIQFLLRPHGVREHLCDEPFVEETLTELRGAGPEDLIVIGGGGLFMDYFVPFWQGFAEVTDRVPFCLWGVGYCDMKRECSRPPAELLAGIVKRSRVCSVRDELTRRQLAGCALPPPVACPTVALIEERPAGFGLLHVDAFDNVGETNYERMNALGAEFSRATGRPFRTLNNLIPAGREGALQSVLDSYAASDLILTGRLHGCVIGLAMGRKVLALSGDHKVESFMEAAGLGDWVLDLPRVEELSERLRALPGQPVPREFVVAARRGNQAIAARVLALLAPGASAAPA